MTQQRRLENDSRFATPEGGELVRSVLRLAVVAAGLAFIAVVVVIVLSVSVLTNRDNADTAKERADQAQVDAETAKVQADALREQSDRLAFEALRNCIRANINGALVRLSAPRVPERARAAKTLYPILDCKQVVVNGRLVELSRREARKYAALVAKGRAPIINMGKVVGSRTGVLEGLQSVDDAGRP